MVFLTQQIYNTFIKYIRVYCSALCKNKFLMYKKIQFIHVNIKRTFLGRSHMLRSSAFYFYPFILFKYLFKMPLQLIKTYQMQYFFLGTSIICVFSVRTKLTHKMFYTEKLPMFKNINFRV